MLGLRFARIKKNVILFNDDIVFFLQHFFQIPRFKI